MNDQVLLSAYLEFLIGEPNGTTAACGHLPNRFISTEHHKIAINATYAWLHTNSTDSHLCVKELYTN